MGPDDELDSAALSRRGLLTGSGLALGVAAMAAAGVAGAQESDPPPDDPDFHEGDPAAEPPMQPAQPSGAPDWQRVRAQWALDWSVVDMSAMLFASNPRIVRDAIARHRDGLDASPTLYLSARNRPLQNNARRAAGAYFGVAFENVALTESTTSSVALVYQGLDLAYGQEALTTTHDYYVTHESLRLATLRGGGTVRKISLYQDAASATVEQIVGRIVSEIRPSTRVLALTWVHSSTGMKMPIREISAALAPINAARPERDRVLFCVDGVHGFGLENTTLPELGCDFLMAGCHKWLFGPRGTGVIFGTPYGWSRMQPTVPSFLAPNAYGAWLGGYDPGPTTGARMTPGGFKAFEHVWALNEAFGFHQWIGKAHVQARTRELAGRLKTGLSQIPGVTVRTPMDPRLSAGIVSFDVAGLSADGVVSRLRNQRVIGSAAPYATRHVRLTPSIRNTTEDVDYALNAMRMIRS
ncbi:MAG: aminotransferase class V-fold PLP-dependent enzyme [Caulobacter sp.]|nr:aminotransferase class V-fold PLP-dependent enzyme [Caulobacter sp.]